MCFSFKCTTCGGGGESCQAVTRCATEVTSSCKAMVEQYDQAAEAGIAADASEFGYASNMSVCREAVICIDCGGSGSSAIPAIETIPCLDTLDSERVLVLLDNIDFTGVVVSYGGASNVRRLAGISLVNATLTGGQVILKQNGHRNM